MQASEIASLVNSKADGADIYLAIRMVPDLHIDAIVQPITASILRISLTLQFSEDFLWSTWWHGRGEPFHVWIEDQENPQLLHAEEVTLHKE
ncbi:activating signal cointegrator 1 complex subunit, partial [Cystoisospora suis]